MLKILLIKKANVTCSKSFFLVLYNPVCLNVLPSVYIMKEKKGGDVNERKEKSFVCG